MITKERLRTEARSWAERIKVNPRRIQVQKMRSKLASCSTRGTVTLSLELLAQPKTIRDQALVHELVHLLVPNHGRVFRALVKAYLPSLRIPTIPATCSEGKRPPKPKQGGHPPERSDAGC